MGKQEEEESLHCFFLMFDGWVKFQIDGIEVIEQGVKKDAGLLCTYIVVGKRTIFINRFWARRSQLNEKSRKSYSYSR